MSKFEHCKEVYNEICILLLTYIIASYPLYQEDGDGMNIHGWIHVYFVNQCIVSNGILILYIMIKGKIL